MLKAILIDIGGPLVDDRGFYEFSDRMLLELLEERGQTIPKEEYQRVVRGFIVRLFPNPRRATIWHFLKPDLEAFQMVVQELRRRRQSWRPERLQPEAFEAIATLSERYQLALAGNQPAGIKEFLRASGAPEYFHFQLVSEEMGVTKPDPVFFEIILDSLGVEPKEAVMVGDRLDLDIFPAKLLGLSTVQVLVGPYAAQEPPAPVYEPELTIASLGELPQVLAKLEGG
jgi:HAD superfamily hydrolase (TIGR01549 family)